MSLPDYETFLREGREVFTAYVRRWHHTPASTDFYHNAWRRLSDERWSHRDIVHDILGEPLEDGGAGGDLTVTLPGDPPVTTSGTIRPFGQRSLQDGNGPALQLTLSDFSLLRLYRQDRGATQERLRQHATRGFTAARVLAQVQDGPWQAREVDPGWPEHLALVEGLTREAIACGLRLEWTLIGGGGRMGDQRERLAFVRAVGQALANVPEGVLFVEMANEPANRPISVPDLIELVDACQEASGGRFLLSPGVIPVADFRRECGGDWRVMTQHLDRDTSKSEGQDRPWRQAWEFGLEGLRWADNEAIGHGSTGSGETRPDVLRSHRLVAYSSRACVSCLHSTPAGVFAEVPWTDIPAYGEAGKARRRLPGNLAEGMPHNANTNFPGRPFDLDPADIRSQNGNTRGLVRLYANECDGVFYAVAFGLISDVTIWSRHNLHLEVWDQAQPEPLWVRDVVEGQAITLPQRTDYLLIGRR